MALGHVTFFCQLFIKVINESVGMNKNIVTNLHLLFCLSYLSFGVECLPITVQALTHSLKVTIHLSNSRAPSPLFSPFPPLPSLFSPPQLLIQSSHLAHYQKTNPSSW